MGSIWSETVTLPSRSALEGEHSTEVAVVGGGMAGVLTAWFLRKRGAKVLLLEADRLAALNKSFWDKDMDPYYGAPTIILVLADTVRYTWVEDGSCALCNMLNAAHALGLGACWIHRVREMFDSEEGKAYLRQWGLPESMRGVGSVALGYPAGPELRPLPRKDGRVIKLL